MQNEPKVFSKKKVFVILGIFLLILTSLRIGWTLYYLPVEQPVAKNGLIDLSSWDFNNDKTITLDGEWGFIPNEWLRANKVKQREQNDSAEAIIVPGNWSNALNSDEPFGYGTYYLTVMLPASQRHLLGITLPSIDVAARMYIDDDQILEYGTIASNAENSQGSFGPTSEVFYTDRDEVIIVIHVANFENPLSGGITDSIKIGNDTAIMKESQRSINLQSIIAMMFLLHAMYAFIVFFMAKGKYRKEFIFLGILLLLNGLTVLIDDDMTLKLPVSYFIYHKILYSLFYTTLLSLVLFVKQLFNVQSRFFKWIVSLFTLNILVILLGNSSIIYAFTNFGLLFYIFSIFYLLYHGIKAALTDRSDAIFILLFIASYSSGMIWGLAINFGLTSTPFYPLDFFIVIIMLALLIIRKHIRVSEINEIQTLELKKVDKARDEFLANTSHELRNPLHGIINIAESVLEQEDKNLSESSKESLYLLTSIGKRMGYTLTDLSTITQLRENKLHISPSIVDVNIVTTFVIDMLEFMKEGKEIELISQVPSNFPKVWADENRLVQILFNLVHNAIKYTDEGSIQIIAEVRGEHAVISIKDTGIGIDTNEVEKIFQRFEQGVRNQSETGSGIGLSVSRQLIKLHGGEITFESSEEGTTFIFSIPLSLEEEPMEENDAYHSIAAIQAPNSEEILDRQETMSTPDLRTVLIVDDDPVNIKVLAQLLQTEYHVITSLEPQAVLQEIPLQNIDVIISDVMMPKMSGYEFTQQIRERFTLSELPVLHITARSTAEDIKVSFESGANDYLVKPVDALELRVRVHALSNLRYYIKESLKFEAAWLQAQIQPHFLYNTLNSIASLAEIDTDEMTDLLHAFGNYLQRSFSIINLEPTVPIKHAIELTKSYVTIEKARFGERLNMEYEIDNNMDVMIPPLSIQPLVENAIMHGVLEKVEGGTVKLSVKNYQAYTEVSISDDGVGMSQDKIKQVLDVKLSIDDGVGVKNTNRRLLHLYNKGLKIKSDIGIGTTISFRIPKEG